MKLTLMIISLSLFTLSTHADELGSVQQSALITSSPVLTSIILSGATSNGSVGKEAQQVLKEGQEYFQGGELAPLIASKVKMLQEKEDLSIDDAVDILMEASAEILK